MKSMKIMNISGIESNHRKMKENMASSKAAYRKCGSVNNGININNESIAINREISIMSGETL
jgi:hypothetical protein